LFKYNQYISHGCNVYGETGVDLQYSLFPVNRESDKKVHCSSHKVLIVIERSQKSYTGFSGNTWNANREFLSISLQHKPRHTKEV